MIGLTPRQRDVYDLIAARLRDNGIAPTFAEMKQHLGMASASQVSEIVKALVERGYIRRIHKRARAIELVREGERAAVTLNPEILALTDRYAAEHKISRDTAANELLRCALENA